MKAEAVASFDLEEWENPNPDPYADPDASLEQEVDIDGAH